MSATRTLSRILKHLTTTAWRVQRHFPAPALAAIKDAIRQAETMHSGEIQFAVEGALDPWHLLHGVSGRERAVDAFAQLRVWDTEHNNGVLIYLLLADHDIEIVVDRGIYTRTGHEVWQRIARQMEAEFAKGNFQSGAVNGITAAAAELARHFPPGATNANELSDDVIVL